MRVISVSSVVLDGSGIRMAGMLCQPIEIIVNGIRPVPHCTDVDFLLSECVALVGFFSTANCAGRCMK